GPALPPRRQEGLCEDHQGRLREDRRRGGEALAGEAALKAASRPGATIQQSRLPFRPPKAAIESTLLHKPLSVGRQAMIIEGAVMAVRNSIDDNIAFMRALAEEGRNAPFVGGPIMLAAGLCFGSASLAVWLN